LSTAHPEKEFIDFASSCDNKEGVSRILSFKSKIGCVVSVTLRSSRL
jgi:hypothetical protein